MRDDYHLNTIRLLISRPPQNWTPELGNNCAPPTYRCFDFNYVMPNGKTMVEVMDDMVDWSAALGMYIIIDYHPVGGHNTQDALNWWSFVAPRYANRTHVIYEAANEPAAWSPSAYTAADVQFEVDIYQHIRNLAPNTHIILWSFGNATADMRTKVDEAPAIDYTNASVAFHPYVYGDANVIDLRNSYPTLSTEIGDNRDSHTVSLENLNVSWVWLDGVWNYTPAQIVTWNADPGAVNMGELPTPTPTSIPTIMPTNTAVPTQAVTPTATNTPASTPASTPTPTNTPAPTNTYQYFSTATAFNGSTCVSASAANSLWSGNWSIRADVYLNQSQTRHPIISKQGQSANERGFWFGIENGNLYLELYHTQTTHTDVFGPALPIGVWTTVEAQFINGTVRLFVNSVQVAQNTSVSALRQNNLNTQLACYVWNSQWSWYFNGQMQNVILAQLP
jgi:aryl-phospho-beta-D-glucosidase BglC (GH1 family)